MKKKLLVTGFGGFVAGSVIEQACNDWDIYALDRIDVPENQTNGNYFTIDLLDTKRLEALYYNIKPDAVIHTAALADIDYCQNNQDMGTAINVGVTRSLANLCKNSGAKMVFCSTDTVFDGKKGMYVEEDQPHPVNFYAETKICAEHVIRDTVENGVICRLSLVVGLPVMGIGNSFLAKTIFKLQAGEHVSFPENEIRTPIDVITLGRALLELAGTDFTGTIHLSGNDRLTRYEMACRIAKKLGYSSDLIVATNSNAMPGRAPRPDDASLNNSKAKKNLGTPMLDLEDGLNLTLSSASTRL